jgi:4-hydroxy-tetrahydrodipicolinate synthase
MMNETYTAIVTPFQNNKVDVKALEKMVEFQIKNGVSGIVPCGTTGESPTLSHEEHNLVIEVCVKAANKRIKVMAGTGSNSTEEAVMMTSHAKKVGADSCLIVAPYYNKPIQKGIIEHYKYIAACTDLPIILYNVPGRTGSNVLPETTIALAEISNIVAMKEASGSMEQIMEIIRLRKPDFGVLSGDDAITMPLIAAGADGVISVVANAFPEKFSKMVHASMEGDLDTARKEHYDLLSITKMFFEEGNPGGVKVALAVRGIMEENMRLPLFPVSDGLRARIAEETKALLKV